MIQLSTERFEQAHKRKPAGSHYWRFAGTGRPTGRRRAKELQLVYETDGPFPKARERALRLFRDRFGVNAEVTVEVLP